MTRQRLPSVGSLGRLSPLLQYYALLRLLVTRLDSPWFPLVPRYRPKKKTFSRKCRDLPGSWVTLCTYAALSDPGRIFVPSHEDEPTRGVAVPDDFRPRLTSLPVPQSALSRCLAASWHVDAAPALVNLEGSSSYFLSGLNHAASALAVYASQPASRQDHARLACQLVANLCCAGLVTRRVTFEVSTHVSSSAKLAWRNDHQKLSPKAAGTASARGSGVAGRAPKSSSSVGSALKASSVASRNSSSVVRRCKRRCNATPSRTERHR